jgi:hypothetical protein
MGCQERAPERMLMGKKDWGGIEVNKDEKKSGIIAPSYYQCGQYI